MDWKDCVTYSESQEVMVPEFKLRKCFELVSHIVLLEVWARGQRKVMDIGSSSYLLGVIWLQL